MNTLDNARPWQLHDGLPGLVALGIGKDNFCLAAGAVFLGLWLFVRPDK